MKPSYLEEDEFITECEERCDAQGWGGFTYNRKEETAYFHTHGGQPDPK